MAGSQAAGQIGTEFEDLLARMFKRGGWRVRRHPVVSGMEADIFIEAGDKRYVVEVKALSEGRSDRLVPLLAQAILQAQALARHFPESAEPLAVVAARRVPRSVVETLTRFAAQYAPGVGVGVIDLEGLRVFVGAGLERFNAKPPRRAPDRASKQRLPDLFSDLNQWMLKIVLGQRLPEALIGVPRKAVRNGSQLAAVAGVSVMSASRFLGQLANQGFLENDGEELRIVRVEELLELWLAANRHAAHEYAARWIIKTGPGQVFAALREYSSPTQTNSRSSGHQRNGASRTELPRCCAGLFAAAEALDLSFVHGTVPHVYLERLTSDSLDRLGVTVEPSDRPADLYIRIPANREAVFRACVTREGVRVTDILQVWLDVSTHPARGREQAMEIRRRVFEPLIGQAR
jgi:Holliday junction resolvase